MVPRLEPEAARLVVAAAAAVATSTISPVRKITLAAVAAVTRRRRARKFPTKTFPSKSRSSPQEIKWADSKESAHFVL